MAFFEEINPRLAQKEAGDDNDRFLRFESPDEFLFMQEAAVARSRFREAHGNDPFPADIQMSGVVPTNSGIFTNPQHVNDYVRLLVEYIEETIEYSTIPDNGDRTKHRQRVADFLTELQLAADLYEETKVYDFEAWLPSGAIDTQGTGAV